MNAGEIFKKIRKERNLTQKKVAEGVCSHQIVSDFEKKGQEISYLSFYGLIKNIGVSLDEFQYELNQYKLSEWERILEQATDLFFEKDINGLKTLLKNEIKKTKNLPYGHDLNCLMIKNLLSKINDETVMSEEEKNQIKDYLTAIEHWGYYELTLFNNTIDIFSPTVLILLVNEFYKKIEFYSEVFHNKNLTILISINIMGKLIEFKEFEEAKIIKGTIYKNIKENQILYKNLFLFACGYLDFSTNKKNEGIQKMKRAIFVFKIVESNNLALTYRNAFNEIVNEK